jgi:Phosphotransferase enzyme family
VTTGRDDLTAAALAAASAVAAGEGVRVVEPRVVGHGSNRIIWLWPAPLVARVMTGTVVLHPDPRTWLAREIDVGAFLAGAGAPIVAPASAVDPGPHLHDGLWVSLWEHVEIGPAGVSGGQVGESLRALHDALAGYPGALPLRSAVLEEIDWLLAALAGHRGVAPLCDERDRLAPLLRTESVAGSQPLHGDASLSNLLATPAGPRWNDFEDVCVGSPAWDVVGLVDDARERHGDAFAVEVLAAYRRDVDPALTELVRDTHALYGTLWRMYLPTTAGAAAQDV